MKPTFSLLFLTFSAFFISLPALAADENTQNPAPPASYLGPAALEFLDADTLCVLQQDARRLDIFSLTTQSVLRSLELNLTPNKMLKVTHGEGPGAVTRIYISCGDLNGEVLEIDPAVMKILRTWKGMHSPWALAHLKSTDTLLISRRFHGDILFVDMNAQPQQALRDAKCVKVMREPVALAVMPDESRVYVANFLPQVPANGSIVAAHISVIDLKTHAVKHILMTDGTNSVRDICITPDGQYVFAVHIHSSHRSVTSQLSGGWTSRNGITILDTQRDDRVGCYLLDDDLLGAPNPWSVRVSPDGKLLGITFAGCREVGFMAVEELTAMMRKDLQGVSSGYVFVFEVGSLMHIMGRTQMAGVIGPRALAMDDARTIAAGYFSDNLAVFPRGDFPDKVKVSQRTGQRYRLFAKYTSMEPRIVPLGPPPVLDAVRRGEIHYHNGELAQERWHSCSTCHPDARVDGMNWDLLNDGIGNHKNTKSMLHAYETPPCMITGVRADAFIATRAGFVHIHHIAQSEPLYQEVDAYLQALRPIPGIALNPDGTLTEAAQRGKRLFLGPKTGCFSCHFGKYYTDMKMHDVLTETQYDYNPFFDTPTLIETYRTAPYLHDGRYTTLEQLLYEGYHGDPEKNLDKLTEQEKADLIEFLLSL